MYVEAKIASITFVVPRILKVKLRNIKLFFSVITLTDRPSSSFLSLCEKKPIIVLELIER